MNNIVTGPKATTAQLVEAREWFQNDLRTMRDRRPGLWADEKIVERHYEQFEKTERELEAVNKELRQRKGEKVWKINSRWVERMYMRTVGTTSCRPMYFSTAAEAWRKYFDLTDEPKGDPGYYFQADEPVEVSL